MRSNLLSFTQGICVAVAWVSISASGAVDFGERIHRQTQELYDAIAPGSISVWEHYLDADARFTTEDGQVLTKAQVLEQTKPLPAGVSGSIRVVDFHAVRHGSVAIANYVADEAENFHGHELHCQYRSTDTWIETRSGWRLIASQTMALRTDPPAMALDHKRIDEYTGRYDLTPAISYEIRQSDGKLEGRQTGRNAESLLAEAPDVFFVPGKPRYRKIFLRGSDGQITGFAERREAWQILWKRQP